MDMFTMKHAHRKHRMSLVSLHPARTNGKQDGKQYSVSCGAYRKSQKSGRMEYEGLVLEGEVPVKEFVRWAKRKGFLKWHRNGHAASAPAKKLTANNSKNGGSNKNEQRVERGNTQALPGTANGGSQRKVAGR
jgi:hypothetical protein